MRDITVCVVGASGLVGANIVKAALDRGYRVNGTLRDRTDPEKTPYLMALPGAEERLTLFQADMAEAGSMSAALQGTDVVYICSLIPTYFGPTGTPAREMDDKQGYAEIINPTVNGCLNIMRSAAEQGVKNVVICSSTSSTNPPEPVPLKNEVDHWSDEIVQCQQKKYTSAAKTVMEKAAFKFAEDKSIRLSVLLPTLMLGPALLPEHAERGFMAVLKQMVDGGAPRHQKIPNNSTSMIHLEDLAELFMTVYEDPSASGRYFGVYDSWHWQDIYAALAEIIPGMQMPEPLTEAAVAPTGFDFARRDGLGVAIRDIPAILRDAVG